MPHPKAESLLELSQEITFSLSMAIVKSYMGLLFAVMGRLMTLTLDFVHHVQKKDSNFIIKLKLHAHPAMELLWMEPLLLSSNPL